MNDPDVTEELVTPATSASGSGCGDGLKLWRADRTEIKLVNCPKGAWPEADEDGKTAFFNTHFKTPEEAWQKVERENEAHIELTLSAINRHNSELEKLKEELVTISLRSLEIKENHQSWNRHNTALCDPAHEDAGKPETL